MTIEEETNRLFFSTLDKEAAKKTVTETLSGCDDGELFLEYAPIPNTWFWMTEESKARDIMLRQVSGFGQSAQKPMLTLFQMKFRNTA